MKRLLRILLNTATVLSLVLCVAAVAIWAIEGEIYFGRHPQFFVVSRNGLLDLGINQHLVTVPLLIPAVVGIFLPLSWLRKRLEARSVKRGSGNGLS